MVLKNIKYIQTEDEKEMVVRTVYCTNIDKKVRASYQSILSLFRATLRYYLRYTSSFGVKVTQTDVKVFFEQLCGEVSSAFFLYFPL